MGEKELYAPPLQMHNNFVELMLSEPKTLRGFVQQHVPEELRDGLDLDSLQPEPRHFIEDNLRKYVVDLLVKAKCKNEELYYYFVIEAKSKPEILTAAQAFHYALKVSLHYADIKKDKPLPLVYPLVLYHGSKKFKYTMDVRELIDASEEAVSLLFDQPVQLIDLSQVPDKELLYDTPFPLSFIELVLKHIYDPDLVKTMNKIEEFMPLFKEYSMEFGVKKALVLLHYWYASGSISDKEQFAKTVSVVDPVFEETVMTLRQAALDEGARKTQTLVASKMLAAGKPFEEIIEFSGLSIKDINQLVGKQTEVV